MTHYKRPPVSSTLGLVERAPMQKTKSGQRVVVEVIGYPDGQFRLSTSEISGPPKDRRIRQHETLMFNDVNEAKDALDALLDRVASEARRAPAERRSAPVGDEESPARRE